MTEKRTTFYIRRAIFLLTALAVAVPLLVEVKLPTAVGWPARDLYEAIEKAPPDKLVVVSVNWAAATQGETGLQTAAIIRHLAMRHRRFAIWGWNYPQGPQLTQQLAEPIAKEYGLKYGTDWINWGFTTGAGPMIRGWAKDIPGTIKQDAITNTPVNKLPVMQGVKSAKDLAIIVDITGSSTVGYYIRYVQGIYGTPLGYACTGVMVAEAFPYLDSGQLVGMLRGLVGAAEYEELIGHYGTASRRMVPQSFAHLLIIALIILGNVGYFMSKRKGLAGAAAQRNSVGK